MAVWNKYKVILRNGILRSCWVKGSIDQCDWLFCYFEIIGQP